jgi:hypothetical protein
MLQSIIESSIVGLYKLLNFITKTPVQMDKFRGIGLESLYPYDLVIANKDYDSLTKSAIKEEELGRAVIGTIISIEKYDYTNTGLQVTKVKVAYFNLCNFKYPLIKIYDASELRLVLSPIKEIALSAEVIQEATEMMDVFNNLGEEDPVEDSEDPEDPEDGTIH